MDNYRLLSEGDPAPWFIQRSNSVPKFHFHAVGGRNVVLCFFGSSTAPAVHDALSVIHENLHLFDDVRNVFFGICTDQEDAATSRLADAYPTMRFFWDFDGMVSKLYGSLPPDAEPGADTMEKFRPKWVVLDPTLRVKKIFSLSDDSDNARTVIQYLNAMPWPPTMGGMDVMAPIIILPDLFDLELCRHLIDLYKNNGGEASGFMREQAGKTVLINDTKHKSRRDYLIKDEKLIAHLKALFRRRAIPEIKKAYQFDVTRMERHIVVCYDGEEDGHFNAHRDNTTKGTAYRQFAVSVNLNDDFEGGEISFPEYGPRGFKPAPGSAVIFSCSLLHAVSKVTRGQRYAFLPFLYNDDSAKLREKNSKYLGEGLKPYQFKPTR